jgi:hypothetical protein
LKNINISGILYVVINKREGEISFYNEEKKLRQSIVIQQEGKPEDTSVKPSGNIGNMTWG